jgi:hypothetical protein
MFSQNNMLDVRVQSAVSGWRIIDEDLKKMASTLSIKGREAGVSVNSTNSCSKGGYVEETFHAARIGRQ